jgi:hypothetical protein
MIIVHDQIYKFMNNKDFRNKRHIPNLDMFILSLCFSARKWEDVARPVLLEWMTRDLCHATSSSPELALNV